MRVSEDGDPKLNPERRLIRCMLGVRVNQLGPN